MTTVQRFLVRFGDNDFSCVLRAFGELMIADTNRKWTDLTPERIAWLFNKIAPGLYWTSQHRFQYGKPEDPFSGDWGKHQPKSEEEAMDRYLHIIPDCVKVNEEADELYCSGNGNGEYLYVDLVNKQYEVI